MYYAFIYRFRSHNIMVLHKRDYITFLNPRYSVPRVDQKIKYTKELL